MDVKVSIIIPCYNHGKFLNEAVDAVLNQTFQDFEIIIVNDGSTDEFTIDLLKNYSKPKTRVINTSNQGLASARNNGIKESKGKYILPLDADDKIANTFLEKTVKIIDSNSQIGIVGCKTKLFGFENKEFFKKYKFPDILINNCFVCTCLFRKSDWEKVGGYKLNMKFGWEDYDFWLSIINLGREVCQIEEPLFYYRQHKTSMRKKVDLEKEIYLYTKLFENNKDLYIKNIVFLFKTLVELKFKNIKKNTIIYRLIFAIVTSYLVFGIAILFVILKYFHIL